MTIQNQETILFVSCYDLCAPALRRQARAWQKAGYAAELLFFKRPGHPDALPFSHREAELLAQEVRRAAPRFVMLSSPEQKYLEPVLRFLRSEIQETPLYSGSGLPVLVPPAKQAPSLIPLKVCFLDQGKLLRLSPKKSALLCP